STPEALTVRAPAALHVVYPSGQPAFTLARLFEEPELKTFEERQKEKRKNQEKDLNRLKDFLEEAKAEAAALKARPGTVPTPKPDLPLESLAPAALGEVPVVIRADEEEDIRKAVAFAGEH